MINMNKWNIIKYIFGGLIALLVFNFTFNLLCPEVDFRDFHISECEYCHSQNMSYGLCSGFCFNSSGSGSCAFNLDRSCQEIPHGSNLGTRTCEI